MNKKTYLRAHDLLMARMRKQMRLKNTKEIRKTGARIHRLRVRYRERFAS